MTGGDPHEVNVTPAVEGAHQLVPQLAEHAKGNHWPAVDAGIEHPQFVQRAAESPELLAQ